MSKWSVTIHQSNHNGSKAPKRRWIVDPPGYNHKNRNCGDHRWQVAGGKWFQWGNGTTKREAWEEAMAYADRKARTREVVLPRDTARPSEHLEIGPMCWGGAVVTTVDDGARLLLNLEEIRPLALALLAHAERMEE